MKYLVSILTLTLLLIGSTAMATDYVLITDNSNPVTALSAKDVKNIYLGKKTVWSDGSHITVFTNTTSNVNSIFMKEVIRKKPGQYATYWKKSLFTGTGLPPKNFASDAEIKSAVAAKPGSIGYISTTSLDDSVKQLDIK